MQSAFFARAAHITSAAIQEIQRYALRTTHAAQTAQGRDIVVMMKLLQSRPEDTKTAQITTAVARNV